MELHFLHESHAGGWERLKPWHLPEEELVSQEGSSYSSGPQQRTGQSHNNDGSVMGGTTP